MRYLQDCDFSIRLNGLIIFLHNYVTTYITKNLVSII